MPAFKKEPLIYRNKRRALLVPESKVSKKNVRDYLVLLKEIVKRYPDVQRKEVRTSRWIFSKQKTTVHKRWQNTEVQPRKTVFVKVGPLADALRQMAVETYWFHLNHWKEGSLPKIEKKLATMWKERKTYKNKAREQRSFQNMLSHMADFVGTEKKGRRLRGDELRMALFYEKMQKSYAPTIISEWMGTKQIEPEVFDKFKQLKTKGVDFWPKKIETPLMGAYFNGVRKTSKGPVYSFTLFEKP